MRLIDADALQPTRIVEKKRIFKDGKIRSTTVVKYVYLKEEIENAPTIEAAPVVHGEWIYMYNKGMSEIYGCTQCGTRRADYLRSPFCPGCGANMMKRTELY